MSLFVIRSLAVVSQRSLHNAPIFRLLLKVAVNGMHQCDFQNFCGALGLQPGPRERVAQRGTRDVSAIAQEVIETRSQRNAQIFRRLLKLAVRGMHQCDCLNFCGGSPWAPTWPSRARRRA